MSRRQDTDAPPHYRRVYKLTVMAATPEALDLDLSQFKSDGARDIVLSRSPHDKFISANLRERRKRRARGNTYL